MKFWAGLTIAEGHLHIRQKIRLQRVHLPIRNIICFSDGFLFVSSRSVQDRQEERSEGRSVYWFRLRRGSLICLVCLVYPVCPVRLRSSEQTCLSV